MLMRIMYIMLNVPEHLKDMDWMVFRNNKEA